MSISIMDRVRVAYKECGNDPKAIASMLNEKESTVRRELTRVVTEERTQTTLSRTEEPEEETYIPPAQEVERQDVIQTIEHTYKQVEQLWLKAMKMVDEVPESSSISAAANVMRGLIDIMKVRVTVLDKRAALNLNMPSSVTELMKQCNAHA